MASLKPAFVPACEAGTVYHCQPDGSDPVLAVPAIAATGVFACVAEPAGAEPLDWADAERPDPFERVRNTPAATAISTITTPSAISTVRRRPVPAEPTGRGELVGPAASAASVAGRSGTAAEDADDPML